MVCALGGTPAKVLTVHLYADAIISSVLLSFK